MPPTRRSARVAGLLYLFVVLSGPFVLLYVPGKLFVPDDAAATAGSILAHQSLFQAHIAIALLGQLFFIAVVFALYRLLKEVSVPLATAMVILILLDTPLALLSIANEVATLTFLRNPGFFAAFDEPQRNALILLLMKFDGAGVLVSEVFWGLWLLPLGVLVHRSGFLPRFLGVWLFVNGLAYVGLSAARLLAPEHVQRLTTIATPVLFGEVALMLWLLIVGVRVRPAERAAPHAPA